MHNAMGLLGLACRARQVTSGETAMKKLCAKQAYLMILADDMGENGKQKVLNKCHYYEVPYVFMNAQELNQAIGRENRKSVAILDKGFAQKLYTCLKG